MPGLLTLGNSDKNYWLFGKIQFTFGNLIAQAGTLFYILMPLFYFA